MAKFKVLDDKVMYRVWDEKTRSYLHIDHKAGEEVELPDEVAARIDYVTHHPKADPRDRGRLRIIPVEDYDDWVAEQNAAGRPENQLTDDQLASMPGNDLIAAVNTTPGLAERVLELEQQRPRPRKQIVEHCERVISAGDGGDVSLADEQPNQLLPAEES
jgi:hypothetical protein